jgi:ribosome-associated translation inhibitor RaiA
MAADAQVQVSVHGAVGTADRARAERRVAGLLALAPRPPRTAHVRLELEPDPALSRPAVAEAELVMADRRLRAHVAAPAMGQAIHLLEARLRRQIRKAHGRTLARRHGRNGDSADRWQGAHERWARPEYRDRPVAERSVVRRKSLALAPLAPHEAAALLEDLHHDFVLFTHAGTGGDAVMRRDAEGWYELVPSAPAMDEAEATARLDATGDPHVVFASRATGRVCVMYRRYDGNYGVLEAPAPPSSAAMR